MYDVRNILVLTHAVLSLCTVNSATYIELVMNCLDYWKISKISQDVHLYWGIFIDHSNMHFNLLNKCTNVYIKKNVLKPLVV